LAGLDMRKPLLANQKFSASFLAATIAFILIISPPEANAQTSITKPSIPEFTAKLILSPPENQSANRTIELSIKNQPDVSFYNVRISVNNGDWVLLYPNNNSVPTQSEDEYTILSYPSGYLVVESQYNLGYREQNLSVGDRIAFQVQAMSGSIHRVFNPNFTEQIDMYQYTFTGELSDWSDTQTLAVDNPASSSPSPTQLGVKTEAPLGGLSMELLVIIILICIVAILALITFLPGFKIAKTKP
jgi:hypothetical protein